MPEPRFVVGLAAGAFFGFLAGRCLRHFWSPRANSALLSRRVAALKPLPIKVIAARVATEAASRSLVNMSQGVPCLPLFEKSVSAMEALVRSGRLPYCGVAGVESCKCSEDQIAASPPCVDPSLPCPLSSLIRA